MIYLAHPRTRQVKWLWSRHLDPQSGNDYIVNTVTGAREWVTPQNDHYCAKRLPSLDPAVSHKLRTLDALLSDVEKRTITTHGRHSLQELRNLINSPAADQVVPDDVQLRLAEIGELVTQEMLKVDAVESEGSEIVRKRRKQVVNRLFEISEEIERLRTS